MVPSKLRNVPPDDGILEVVGVGHVEHLEDRLERALAAQVERPGEPDVPREVGVVLRIVFRCRTWPSGQILLRRGPATHACPVALRCSAPQVSDAGCAEYALTRLLR